MDSYLSDMLQCKGEFWKNVWMIDNAKVSVKDLGGVGKGGGVIFCFLKSYMQFIGLGYYKGN